MPQVQKTVDPALDIKEFADQSVFVRTAISGVAKEGVIAAALTAVMILLFIGSWRSTVIIALCTGPILGAVLPPLERRLHEPVHVEAFPAP